MPRSDRMFDNLDELIDLERQALAASVTLLLVGGALLIYSYVSPPGACEEFVLSHDSSCPVGSPLEVVDHLPICRCPP